MASLEGIASKGLMDRLTGFGFLLIVGLAIYWAGLAVYRLFFHPLAKFPGPPLMAISALPFLYQSYIAGRFTWKSRDLHAKYGKIVRIAPNLLAVDGAVGWNDMNAHRPGGTATEFVKVPNYFGKDGHRSIIGAPTREDHRRHRRALAHAFSDAAMHEQEPVVNYYVDLLIRRLSESCRRGEAIDMLKYFNFVSFDIIGDLALADSFGSLQNNNYHPWILNMFKGIRGAALNRFLLSISPLLAPLAMLDLTGAIKTYFQNRVYSEEKARARMVLGPDTPATNFIGHDGKPLVRKDFLGYMMRENRDKEVLSDVELIRNANTLIVAGSETTATNMSTLSFCLSLPQHKKWLEAVTAEVRGLFQSEADVHLRSVGSNVLPVLHACIEEALRLHPPASETPPRVSPGAMVGGLYVPKGTHVQIFQLATFHNPEYFLDATEFRPQRFLPPDHPLYEPRFAKDNMAVFKPFSYGPRDCIGKNLAYAEMRLIMTRIILRFDYMGLDESGVDANWLNDQRAFNIWDKPPLLLKIKERKDVEVLA